jgi:Spy/CpxP family protein refolding chaperone
MKRFATLFCLLALAALPAMPAFAGGPHHHAATADAAAGPAHHFDHLAKALALTDDQKAAAKPLQDELQAATQPLMAQMREQHQQIRAALDSGADAATVGNLMIAAHANQQKMKEAHDKFIQGLSSILTPDQQKKLESMKQQRGAWRGHGPRGMDQ